MAKTRYSYQRELIYNAVCSRRDHPTAEMIFAALRPENPSLSLGTVYRNLSVLAREGKVVRMPFPVERYDGEARPHTHFCCKKCGGVFDMEGFDREADSFSQVEEKAAALQPGFQVERHELIFYGLCPGCAAGED